jgi:hypothetical protein
VRLNAYLNAIPFYEKLGFRREYEVVRWHGAPGTPGGLGAVRPVRLDDLEALASWDETSFGANRRPLLDRLADEVPSTFLISERRGAVQGYIVGNPSGDSCEIGPWTVAPGRPLTARDLFHGVVLAAGVSEVAFSGPSRNEDLLEWVRALRFQEVFRALRMVWGTDEFAGDPRGVWALGGLEKG